MERKWKKYWKTIKKNSVAHNKGNTWKKWAEMRIKKTKFLQNVMETKGKIENMKKYLGKKEWKSRRGI